MRTIEAVGNIQSLKNHHESIIEQWEKFIKGFEEFNDPNVYSVILHEETPYRVTYVIAGVELFCKLVLLQKEG